MLAKLNTNGLMDVQKKGFDMWWLAWLIVAGYNNQDET
jgi:hypothetical protein